MKHSFGSHWIIEAWDANPQLLDDEKHVREVLLKTIGLSGATLIDLCVHHFSPHGVTATATLKESHLAMHTWPESRYLAADLFFCREGEMDATIRYLTDAFEARACKVVRLERGIPESTASGPTSATVFETAAGRSKATNPTSQVAFPEE